MRFVQFLFFKHALAHLSVIVYRHFLFSHSPHKLRKSSADIRYSLPFPSASKAFTLPYRISRSILQDIRTSSFVLHSIVYVQSSLP